MTGGRTREAVGGGRQRTGRGGAGALAGGGAQGGGRRGPEVGVLCLALRAPEREAVAAADVLLGDGRPRGEEGGGCVGRPGGELSDILGGGPGQRLEDFGCGDRLLAKPPPPEDSLACPLPPSNLAPNFQNSFQKLLVPKP